MPHERTLQPRPRTLTQRVVGIAAGSVLLYLAWTGVTGFLSQLSHARGIGQVAQTGSQLLFGIGAVLCLVTTAWGQRWAGIAGRAWIAGATLAGGLAPVVWGGAAIWLGLLASIASLGVALALLWMFRWGFPTSERHAPSS